MLNKSIFFIGFLLSLFLDSYEVYANDSCHPTISDSSQNFIIGYSSLIETESRQATNPDANDAYPIIVNGFQRLWGIDGGYYKTTFLTVRKKADKFLNAIYYQATENDI